MSQVFSLVLDVWDPGRGGLEFYAEELRRALVERGCAVRIVCGELRAAAPEQTEVEQLSARGVEFYRALDDREDRAEEVLLHFRHPGRKPGVFLPLGGIFAAALDARRAAEPWPLRVFKRWARSCNVRTRVFLAREQAFFAQQPPCTVLASSELTASEIRSRFPGFRGAVHVTGLPVDETRYALPGAGERRHAREALGFEEETKALLWLGNDPVRKGLPLAREILRRLRDRALDARLICAGHGTERWNGREPGLVGLGMRGDVPTLCHAADVCFQPSLEDNLSFAVLEALATGLPVVTTRRNGAACYLSGPDIGEVLEDPKDVEAADRAVLLSLRAGQLAAASREARRRAVASCFRAAHFDRVRTLLGEAAIAASGSRRA